MELLEKDIEDIIYESPWLLDERFDIPNIRGLEKSKPSRQVNVGANGVNRFIDLLFRDTRDNRPVIVELKKEELVRENIAQILEYRALVVSLDEQKKNEWFNEFGKNYYCPKLILVGTTISEGVAISANLAGVDIRLLKGVEQLSVDFSEIGQISQKLNEWNGFMKSGNRTIDDRETWIREIYAWVNETIVDFGNEEVTVGKLVETNQRNSWVTGSASTVINLPVFYNDKPLCGLYEYYDEVLHYSSDFIYFDFKILDEERIAEDKRKQVEAKTLELLSAKKYKIVNFEQFIASIRFERNLLDDKNKFKEHLTTLIMNALWLNNEIEKYSRSFS